MTLLNSEAESLLLMVERDYKMQNKCLQIVFLAIILLAPIASNAQPNEPDTPGQVSRRNSLLSIHSDQATAGMSPGTPRFFWKGAFEAIGLSTTSWTGLFHCKFSESSSYARFAQQMETIRQEVMTLQGGNTHPIDPHFPGQGRRTNTLLLTNSAEATIERNPGAITLFRQTSSLPREELEARLVLRLFLSVWECITSPEYEWARLWEAAMHVLLSTKSAFPYVANNPYVVSNESPRLPFSPSIDAPYVAQPGPPPMEE